MASATGGKYYASPVAKNLDEIFNNIYKSIIRTNSPSDVDLTLLLPKNVISNNNFSIEPTKNTTKEKIQIEWENISQHVGNKDKILTEDEIFTVAYIIEKLPSIDGKKIGNKISINYNDISNGEKKVEFNNID